MCHWNAIADTLHSGEVFLPLLLQDENGITHANDWATGFLRGMEFHKGEWASLLADEEHGGWLVPIFALANEHSPDPEMRPYKEPVSTELREKLIVGAAAGVTGISATSKHSGRLKRNCMATQPPSAAQCQRLGATIRVHADQGKNSSSAVASQHCINPRRFANKRDTHLGSA